MTRLARTPAEVIASEISYRSPETAWADALAIASVVANRALALGVTQQQVVGVQREFNAYNKRMPYGADVELAQEAIDNVAKYGPVTPATFYAMPKAVDNLPPSRVFDMAVEGGHQYFTEPTGGAIKTKAGVRAPVNIATVNAAAAQRKAYELSLVDENSAGLPTPEARPDDMMANAVASNRVAVAPVPIPTVESWSAMAAAQPIQATPTVATADQLAAAASRFGEDPSAMIASPEALEAALSRLNTPAANPMDITQAMNDAIARSVAESQPSEQAFDAGRMADSAPLSQADRVLQGMMKEAAENTVNDRFAGPARPITQTVKTTSIPGEVPAGSYISGSMPASFNTSAVAARSVPTLSITPDLIDSPEALSAALSSIGAAPAMVEATAAKGDRIGAIDATNMDQGRFSPDNSIASPEDLQAALSRMSTPATNPIDITKAMDDAIASSIAASVPSVVDQPADIGGFAEAISAQRGPATGINSAEMQAVQGSAERQLQEAVAAKTASMAANSNLAEGMQAQREIATPAITANPEDDAASFAEEVASQKTSRLSPQDVSRIAKTTGIPAVTPEVPALETVDVAPQPATATATEEETPAPALETVAVPDLPAVKSYTPTVAKTASSMPAVQQRQNTAMDVWSGKAQTGIATDGSTVSRLSGNKIGRYVPEYDYTVFSQDDGATWSSPVAGNQLTPAKPSSLASIQPARQSLISRLVSVLTGTVPGSVSPTDVGPSMGLDGGMSVGRDGPAGAPGGWGPGGSISNPGSAGGYGSTGGRDPRGTH